MKNPEVESILLVDKYLICRIFEKKTDQVSLTRRYLARKINKALQRRNKKDYFFSFLGF